MSGSVGDGHETGRTADDVSGRPAIGRRVLIASAASVLAVLSFLAGSGAFSGLFGGGEPDDVNWDDAVVVAADELDGVRGEVLVASDDVGGCVAVRLVEGGRRVRSDGRCATYPTPWADPEFAIVTLDDYFGSFGQYPLERDDGSWVVVLAGAVHPDVVRVTTHLGDGSEYSFVTRNDGGWFVTVVPPGIADPEVASGYLVNAPVRLELFDADGTRVASVDLVAVLGRGPGAA